MHIRIVPLQIGALLISLAACTSKAPPAEGPSHSGGASSPAPGGGGTPTGSPGNGPVGSGGSGGSQATAGGNGGSQAGTGGNAGSSGPARRTLAQSEFVFARQLRQGNFYDDHIHTYNLETGAETVVTTLGYQANTAGSGSSIVDLAVSSDRSQVLFSSGSFRPDPVQVSEKLRLQALWTTDLEGRDFRRLTAEYKPGFNQGLSCATSSLPCASGEVCRNGYCIREDLRVSLTSMVWSPTGKIFFQNGQSWWIGTSSYYSFGYLVSVTPDGRHESYDMPGLCRVRSPGDVSPSTQQLLVFRVGCRDGVANGIIAYSLDPFQERQVLAPESPDLSLNVSRGRFSPDQKTFYFTAAGSNTRPGGQGPRTGLYRLTLEGVQVQKLFESTVDNEDVVDLAILADGAIVVEVRNTAADRSSTSRLARFQTTSNTLEYLPIQGDVRKPR